MPPIVKRDLADERSARWRCAYPHPGEGRGGPMSQYYQAGDIVLWNPSSGVSRVFLGQVRLFENELSLASGVGPMEADECQVDLERAGAEVRASRFDGRQHDIQVGSGQAPSVETEDELRQRAHALLRFMPR
jgi:hypothetical protein